MRVLYDSQAFTSSRVSGVSRSFCELIAHLPSDVCAEISVVQSNNLHLQGASLCPDLIVNGLDMTKWRQKVRIRGAGKLYNLLSCLFPSFPAAERNNRQYSIKKLREGDYDVFHPTWFDPYFLKHLGGKPFVLTVHDMMPEIFTEYYKRDDNQIVWKRMLVKKAAATVVVSECTKRDLMRILGVPEEKITVVHHGGPKPDMTPEQSIVGRPYILYVGRRGTYNSYKNFPRFVEGFGKCLKRNPDMFLVCTYNDFTKEERKVIVDCGVGENVKHIDASDVELRNLYKNAVAFVYPSMYEGFGMPILEAFSYGCPVLLNKRSCFPEIAGDAALYFESDNRQSNIDEALETAWNWSREERDRMRALGYERLRRFSWEKSAKKLRDVYFKVLRNNSRIGIYL